MKHLKKYNEGLNESNSDNSIPTAEEFLNDIKNITYSQEEMMIEFAKLHVEAALQSAADNYSEGPSDVVEKLILSSYPENNIK